MLRQEVNLTPFPTEEFLFFDHPSGWHRIHRAMIWKADNLDDPAVRSGEVITPEGGR